MAGPIPDCGAGRVERLTMEARLRFGRWIDERVNPGSDARDRAAAPLSRAIVREAAEIGLLDFALPAETGGQARDKFEWGIVLEEVARLCRDSGLTPVVDMNAGVAEVLVASGNAALVERYAVPMARGARIGMPAAYEGRDPFDYQTTAREVDGGWVLDGGKPFVTGGLLADTYLVYAREEDSGDILSFVVERDDPGVTVTALHTTGMRSVGFASVGMDRVRLGEDRLVDGVDALSAMNTYFRNRRLMTAAAVVGHMQALVDACVDALEDRQRSGRIVLEFPNVQRSVGEMHAAVETSRAMVHRALAATYGERDQFFDPLSTVAKHFAGDQALRVGLAVMQLQGGEGYLRRRPWERYVRDMLALLGGQGAQEILLIQLGQQAAMEVQQRQMRMETAQRTIAELTDSWWAFTVLVSALECGLIDQLRVPTTPSDAGERLGAPVRLVEEMLDVLAATGLVRRDGEHFAVTDGLESLLGAAPIRTAIQSEALSAVLQGGGFLDRARRGRFAVGWHHDDPELLEAQGRPSAAICEILLGKLAHQLDGLDERLHAPDARLLDVGTGTAQTAVELCRRLPDARVVGLDPMPEAIAVAERIVADSGFADRITLRRLGLEELDDPERFDFAWVPAVFLPRDALVAGLRRLHGSLRPGGWALLLTVSIPDPDLRGAVSRFQNVRWAGESLLPEDVQGMLEEAGFGSIRILSDPLVNTMRFVAARRSRRVPAAD
ncbi:MAG TPA: acyl-CoA dehydrogenase family protein [Terriglobales bacterium]|nr:acyl-CoA dehydrogenase family protein [Terriglobales bacterium]